MTYDAVLLVSFGGPECREDVIPFLENVLRGRNVPRERLLEVAEHYYHFGGKSPINDQNRLLIASLEEELREHGPNLPVYWGNRNWHPFLADTIAKMRDAGVKRAIAFATSAYSSYSGCRQYREDIQRARDLVGPDAPGIDKIRPFYANDGYLEPVTGNVADACRDLPAAQVLFTAHSIPLSMAETCAYQGQVEDASRRVAESLHLPDWSVAYQSQSAPRGWLGPSIESVLQSTAARQVVLVPIGFLSDHMEVLYDLDEEAVSLCNQRGIAVRRAATVGNDPRFVKMIRDLIAAGPPEACPENCCPRPPVKAA